MKKQIFLPVLFLSLVLAFTLSLETTAALEYVRFLHNGKERSEEGRIVLEEPDGFALEARDGRLYAITPDTLISRRRDDMPFVPYTKAEMLERLKVEFPPSEGYHFLDTYGPFIVVYTTSRPYANWCGSLLEKLHTQCVPFWQRFDVELTTPEFPLVAIVFSNEERFRNYIKQEGVTLFSEQRAYYHKLTNRIVLYDITGQQVFQEENQRRAMPADIRSILSHPNAYHNIMTVAHEAIHLVGFNTGMHPRHTSNPVWFYEGLAIVHEVPDLRRLPGWTLGLPHVNRSRLDQLRQYLARPHRESPIKTMLQHDELFRRLETALDNYALAWGITYYLVRMRPKEFAAYIKILQAKTPLSDDTAEIRIREFESCFGSDWEVFDRDFRKFLSRL